MLAGLVKRIPAPWLDTLRVLWPLLWRLAVLVAVFAMGWHYGGKEAERDLQAERVRISQAALEAVEAVRAEQAQQDLRSREVERDYEDARMELDRVRRELPARVVRLCRTAGDRPMPSVPGAAGVPDGAGTDPADVQGAAGPDIGPDLYALADECDDAVRRLDGLHQWVRTVPRQTDAGQGATIR